MSLKTKSVFYYGHVVEATSNTIRINEGAGDIDVELVIGKYSLTEYLKMISRELNDATTQDYTITLDRDTRVVVISAAGNFDLKIADIYPLNSGYPILGFKEVINRTGSNSYSSDAATGFAYYPQFTLQGYVDFSMNREYLDASINRTAKGVEEVVSFGLIEHCEFDIKGITNNFMPLGAPIENNLTGVEDAEHFLSYCISKGGLEFMRDREYRYSYDTILLARTKANSKGVGFKLYEDKRVNGYYSSQVLKFKRSNI